MQVKMLCMQKETENRKQKTENGKKSKSQEEKNRYKRTHTQHVAGLRTERFIWHLKMIIGYKLIATMLTLSANRRRGGGEPR